MDFCKRIFVFFLSIIPTLSLGGTLYYKDESLRPLLLPVSCLRDGIYVGGSVGYDNYHIRQNSTFIDGSGDTFNTNPTLSTKGWAGNVLLGYGQYYGWLYIAGELQVILSSAQSSYAVSSPTSNYETHFAVRESYAASILPGYRLNDKTLVYGRLGLIRTAFKSEESITNLFGNNSISTSHWEHGIQFGLGVETFIVDHWSLRFDYAYTTFSSQDTDFGSEFSPSNNEFMLGLLYHFC